MTNRIAVHLEPSSPGTEAASIVSPAAPQLSKPCIQAPDQPSCLAVPTRKRTDIKEQESWTNDANVPQSRAEPGFAATSRGEKASPAVHESAMHKRRRVAGKERLEQPPERVPSRKAASSAFLIQSSVTGSGRPPTAEYEKAGSRSRPGLGPSISVSGIIAVDNARREASPTVSPDDQDLIGRREHLKLRVEPRTCKTTGPPLASPPWGRLPLPSDSEVTAAVPIAGPPTIKNRRKTEKFARTFALVAYRTAATTFGTKIGPSHTWEFPKVYSAPQFLVCLFSISRNFRYAATLAFTFLTFLEFAGHRTDVYVKSKAADLLVYDLRPWYFHRRAEMTSLIEEVRRWWGERVWKYMLNSDRLTNEYGHYFGGISSCLLRNPDHPAQWDVARRFWIQRFSAYVGGMGSGYQQFLRDLQAQIIISCEPLLAPHSNEAIDGRDASPYPEIWRLGTKDGGIFFVVGRTGEVLGWNNCSTRGRVTSIDAAGVIPRQELEVKSKICTQACRATTGESPHLEQRYRIACKDAVWRGLRGDWQTYISAVYSNDTTSREPAPIPLIQHVFYPSLNKTHPHGINNTITFPHHYALAERFILTHVHPGGVSGPQLLPPIASRKPRIALDLEYKWAVESVRCSGERYRASTTTILAPGVGFIQTLEAGWFVLEETGQEIAMEEYGIQGLWATILGVREDGSALPKEGIKALRSCFVRDRYSLE